MSLSPSTTLIAALKTAVESITIANGFRTDIGYKVLIDSARRASDNEVPCVLLAPGSEVLSENAGMRGHVDIQVSIGGYLDRKVATITEYTADPSAEFAIIDAVIADIRQAIEGTWCALSLVGQAIQYSGAQRLFHEEGGRSCGAEVTYIVTTPYIDFIPGNEV